MNTRKTLRLWYSDMWGHGSYQFNPNHCYFTALLSLRYNILITNKAPDILIFSCFGSNHLQYSNCLKIFFCGENSSPAGVQRMITPDYRLCDLSLTQFPTSEKNYYFPLWVLFVNWFKLSMPLPLPSNPTYLVEPEDLVSSRNCYSEEKERFCCFINNNPIEDRIQLFNILNNNQRVDSYGKLCNNMGHPLDGDERTKLDILKKTAFTIAYENSYAPGYNTEKVIHPYTRGSVAIYSGGLDRTIFNSRSLFYIEDYGSTTEMADDILRHAKDDTLLEKKVCEPLFVSNRIPSRFEPVSVLSWLESKIVDSLENKQ